MQNIESLRRSTLDLIKELEDLKKSPMIYHAPRRVDSIAWAYTHMQLLSARKILHDLNLLEERKQAGVPGVRNLTPAQFLPHVKAPQIPESAYVVFGD